MNDIKENIVHLGIEIGPIVLITLVAIIFCRTVIFKSLSTFASISDSKHDDIFVESLKKPLTLVPLGIGMYALVNALSLPDTYAEYGTLIVQTYFSH